MPNVTLTSHLVNQAGLEKVSLPLSIPGSTIRQVIDALCAEHARLRGYLLDDQGALRHHVAAFVNGSVVRDKINLDQPLAADDELSLLQALSGG